MEILNELINNLLVLLGSWGAVLGCFLILIESMVPILPLSVFITLNFLTFGKFVGFIISWIFTICGCMISYFIFKKGLSKKLYNKIKDNPKLNKVVDVIRNLSFSNLVILIAIPFTPAFLINIAAGLSNMNTKKFLGALIIGKISLVYFWGYIGVSLIESLKNPMILIKVGVIVLVMYLISLLFSKKLNLK